MEHRGGDGPVRVIVPCAGSARQDFDGPVHPATREALARFAPHAEYHDVSASEDAYWELLASVWADGEGFVVVEHDVVVDADTLPAFDACPEPRCGCGYLRRMLYTVAESWSAPRL